MNEGAGMTGIQTPRERNLADIGLIALKHGVTRHDVIGKSRLKKIMPARLECARHFRDKGLGVTEIGRIMRRDHSTIRHMLKIGTSSAVAGASEELV